jgi:hypothetical protein
LSIREIQVNKDIREYIKLYKISEITVDKLRRQSYNKNAREIATAKVPELPKSSPLARVPV